MEDILLIDKPAGWTSFDVVAKIRGQLRRQMADNSKQQIDKSSKSKIKVGHAGTLDPFATGLLIILVGDACKKADEFLKLDKTYEFTAKLGEVSSTGDLEGVIKPYRSESLDLGSQNEPIASVIPAQAGIQSNKYERSESEPDQISNIKYPSIDEVQRVLKQFIGEITQTPPAYSAIKINGKRAYKLAREGKKVETPSRKVTVYKLQVAEYEYPYLKCVCEVSSGTYIRSLVEDIGKSLGTGAYCTELRRTQIGSYQIEQAQVIDKTL